MAQAPRSLDCAIRNAEQNQDRRDKLARWKQTKDVSSFNEDFQKILLDIPTITIEEQLDRYARGLKTYIWKELCTKE